MVIYENVKGSLIKLICISLNIYNSKWLDVCYYSLECTCRSTCVELEFKKYIYIFLNKKDRLKMVTLKWARIWIVFKIPPALLKNK